MELESIRLDQIASATTPAGIRRTVNVAAVATAPRAGDVVAVRALGESITYGNLELPSGRLAKINKGNLIAGVLGSRKALKGFVGSVPASLKPGDRLSILNMGGVMGICSGHHSSLSSAIEAEYLGTVVDESGVPVNIADVALSPANSLATAAELVFVGGTCMNSGKTVAATELIKQARAAGLTVCGAKISGVACLRDTLDMQDHGAAATASFLDCGLPSTAGVEDLAPVAKAVINSLERYSPDVIVVELGDGVVGGYAVDSVLKDAEIRNAISSFVFCASDYAGVVGGAAILKEMGIAIDVIAGSVTDSQMGEDFIRDNFGFEAGNARRDGERLFDLLGIGKGKRDVPSEGFTRIREFQIAG